jgi:hypothetical protein
VPSLEGTFPFPIFDWEGISVGRAHTLNGSGVKSALRHFDWESLSISGTLTLKISYVTTNKQLKKKKGVFYIF